MKHLPLLLTALSLTLVILVFSCHKNELSKMGPSSFNNPKMPMTLRMARRYYNKLQSETGNDVKPAQLVFNDDSRVDRKYPLWKMGYEGKTDSTTFVEVPLLYNRRPADIIIKNGVKMSLDSVNQVLNASFDRLVIYKDNATGVTGEYILTYIPDIGYVNNHKSEISDNHINDLKGEFNGYIRFMHWDGTPAYLYRVDNGALKKRVTFGKTQTYSSSKVAADAKKTIASTSTVTCTEYCTDEYAEDCFTSIEEGNPTITCSWVFIGTVCTEVCTDDGSGDPDQPAETAFDNNIHNLLDHPCMTAVLNAIKGLQTGKIADIVKQFSGTVPNYNWTVQNGNAGTADANTVMSADNTTAISTFNFDLMGNYSDLAMARTMIHEAVHAYLQSYFINDPTTAGQTYPQLLDYYQASKSNSDAQHQLMGTTFVSQIAAALKEYGQSKNYNLSDQVYSDLAWGGLYTSNGGIAAFNALSPGDRERIRDQNISDNSSRPGLDTSPSSPKACP